MKSFTIKEYPAELSLSTWICFMGTLLGAGVSLVMERDFSAWAVGFDSRLLAPIYTVRLYLEKYILFNFRLEHFL